jgi:hypothetical protein
MRTRTKSIIVAAAALLLAAVILLPRISEARRKARGGEPAPPTNPAPNAGQTQDQKAEIKVVASYHNDTSKPVRDMKPQPAIPKQQHEKRTPRSPTSTKTVQIGSQDSFSRPRFDRGEHAQPAAEF